MTQRKLEYWVIPPDADGEFVAHMEAVLDTYAMPYDKRFPVVCMDEQPVQLLKETRTPIAATKEKRPGTDRSSRWRMRARGPGDCSSVRSVTAKADQTILRLREPSLGTASSFAEVLPHPRTKWERVADKKIPARSKERSDRSPG